MRDTNEKYMPGVSRRHVLRTAALLAAAPALVHGFSGEGLATEEKKNSLDLPLLTKKRTLGSGKFRMEVSALGFGVMGANYIWQKV